MKILVADDDSTSRHLLTGVLTKLGHAVVETVDGQQAWAAMQRSDAPSMAIIDWVMPNMDGVTFCRQLRSLPHDTPPYLILLTTRRETACIVEGLDSGADDYLVKPVDPGELRARIDVGARLLGHQRALADKVRELERASAEIRMLQGILPLCCSCKRIRDDHGYWQQVEEYLFTHSQFDVSHGLCPECVTKIYPDFKDSTEGNVELPGPATCSSIEAVEIVRNESCDFPEYDLHVTACGPDGNRFSTDCHPAKASPEHNDPIRKTPPVRGTILLAEDEDMLRNLVERMLRSAGYTVITARDGEEAVEQFKLHNEKIDLVLTDMAMPKLSGDEVYRQIRDMHPSIPVLFSTGYEETADLGISMPESSLRTIIKPFQRAELLKAVRTQLDQR